MFRLLNRVLERLDRTLVHIRLALHALRLGQNHPTKLLKLGLLPLVEVVVSNIVPGQTRSLARSTVFVHIFSGRSHYIIVYDFNRNGGD